MRYIYSTDFRLANPVNDFDKAQAYLAEDDMTQFWHYWHKESKVVEIHWELLNEQEGIVAVVTNAELTQAEADEISSWIRGQNSDGLGESFEQQDFAWISYDEDEPWDGEMASFDWETNDYRLTLIRMEAE